MSRSIKDINNEYSVLCGKIGHIEVQLIKLNYNKQELHNRIEALQIEMKHEEERLTSEKKVEKEIG